MTESNIPEAEKKAGDVEKVPEKPENTKRKKRIKRAIIGLIIFIPCLAVFCTPQGWRALAVITGNYRFDAIADDMERQQRTKERAEKQLKQKPELERAITEFEAFLKKDEDDRDKAAAIKNHRGEIERVRSVYNRAFNTAGKGYASYDLSIDNALNLINDVRAKIERDTQRFKRKRELMSPAEIAAEKTGILCNRLHEAGKCYNYEIDSTGFNTGLNMFAVNGYRSFEPQRFAWNKCRAEFREIGLKTTPESDHDLMIFLLKSDDLSGERFYGRKADFNMTMLRGINDKTGYLIRVKCQGRHNPDVPVYPTFLEKFVACNRVVRWWIDGRETFVVDLRPHGRQRWSVITSIDVDDAKAVYANQIPVILEGPAKNILKFGSDPTVQIKHWRIERFLQKSNGTGNAVNVTDVMDVLVKNGSEALKAGNEFERLKDFASAYKAYLIAAAKGEENGAYNCAVLLLQKKHIVRDKQFNDISIFEAQRLLQPLTVSSDKNMRGSAFNALGVSYNMLRKYREALPCFEKSAASGNTFGKENLNDLRNFLRKNPHL